MFVQDVFWTVELFHGITRELFLLSMQSQIFYNEILMKKLRKFFSWLYPGTRLYDFLYCPPHPPKGGAILVPAGCKCGHETCQQRVWGVLIEHTERKLISWP